MQLVAHGPILYIKVEQELVVDIWDMPTSQSPVETSRQKGLLAQLELDLADHLMQMKKEVQTVKMVVKENLFSTRQLL